MSTSSNSSNQEPTSTDDSISWEIQSSTGHLAFDTRHRYECNLSEEPGSRCNPCAKDPAGIGLRDFGVWERSPINCNSFNRCQYHCNGLDPGFCNIGSGQFGSDHAPEAGILNPVPNFPRGTLDGKLQCATRASLAAQDTPFVVNYTNGIEGALNPADKTSQDFGKLYRDFCGRVATHQGTNDVGDILTCPSIDPDGNEVPRTCSYFKASGSNPERSPDSLCNAWGEANPSGYDQGVNQYCQTHPDDPGCLCVNPENNPTVRKLFQTLREDQEVQLLQKIGCWYRPCTLNDSVLVPKSVQQQQTNCEQAFLCQRVIGVIRRNNLDLEELRPFLVCSGSQDEVESGNGGVSDSPLFPGESGLSPGLPPSHLHPRTVFGIIIIVVTIALIIIGIVWSTRSSSSSGPKKNEKVSG